MRERWLRTGLVERAGGVCDVDLADTVEVVERATEPSGLRAVADRVSLRLGLLAQRLELRGPIGGTCADEAGDDLICAAAES